LVRKCHVWIGAHEESAIFAIILYLGSVSFAQDVSKMFYQDVAWSPDGKLISATGLHDYVKDTDGFKTDIYVMRSDGSGLTKITGDELNDYYTSLSKKRVAYSSGIPKAKESSIFTANFDGSDLRRITQTAAKDTAPAFSPDGKRIAFMSQRDGAKHQIYVMNADGSDVRKLTDDPAMSFCNPQWSPDGKRIAYYTDKGDRKDQVWVMNADGSNKTLLTAGIGHNIFQAGRMTAKGSSSAARTVMAVMRVTLTEAISTR
jgi:TolB protein